MSEADTPNNQPTIEPTESTDDSGADLSEVTETSVNLKVINLFQFSEVNDLEEEWQSEESSESDHNIISEEDENRAEVIDTDREERNKDADWFALAQKMRQRNRRLFEQVNELKQALKEKQQGLTAELMRSQERDSLLTRQAEEIQILQGQLSRLFQTLESSHQSAQRQQILIETLSEQLQSSQERVAQLERECSLTQQRYNDQSHQLLQEANNCRELKTRLQRQQQQTLQFKIALEKCLEMPANSPTEPQQIHDKGDIYTGCVLKNKPIKPWSTNSDFLADQSDINSLWNRPIKLQSLSTFPLSDLDLFEPKTIEQLEQLPTINPIDSSETNINPSSDNSATEMEVEEQLLAEMTALAQASGLSEAVSDFTEEQEESIIELAKTLAVYDESLPEWRDSPVLSEDTEFSGQDGESWEDRGSEEEDESNDVSLPQPNSPSPLIYPLRRPKKIKSLAAIELPTFPRYRTT